MNSTDEITLPTLPDQRTILAKWANPWRRVVCIDINPKDRQVRILTGKIMDPTEFGVNPKEEIIVYFDQKINTMADDADDAHSKVFKIDDPHLLWATEAHLLIDAEACLEWFEKKYPIEEAGNSQLLENIRGALLKSPYEPPPGIRI